MSQIAPVDFRDNLFSAFSTFWAGRTPVAYPNKTFKPEEVAGDLWVELTIAGGNPGQQSIGDSVNSGKNFQRTGTFGVLIYQRQNTGTRAAYEAADAVKQFMESPRAMGVPNTVFTSISEPQEVGPDGVWWQLNQTCTFVYFTDRG